MNQEHEQVEADGVIHVVVPDHAAAAAIAEQHPDAAVVWLVHHADDALRAAQSDGLALKRWAVGGDQAPGLHVFGLAEAVERRSKVVARISEGLRNPLSAVCGAAELLRHEVGASARARRAARIIVRQARHMGRLLDDLIDLSEVLESRGPMAPVDLSRVIDGALQEAQTRVSNEDIELQVIGDGPGLWVEGDADRLRVLFLQLISSAMACQPMPIRIDVCAQATGDGVELSVCGHENDGAAPDPQPFFAAGVDEAVEFSITTIAALAHAHGATLWASRVAALGCRLSVVFPRAHRGPPSLGHDTRRRRMQTQVVLVEARDELREMLTLLLERSGLSVVPLPDLDGALDRLHDAPQRESVVVIDLASVAGLPEQFAQTCQQLPVPPYLVALSSNAADVRRSEALSSGFDAFVTKPFETRELIELIRARPPLTR